MSRTYRISKGVNIRLQGESQKSRQELSSADVYAIKPPDFHGLVPKLSVKEGHQVKAGTVIFEDKYNNKVKFVSPVSGEIAEIVRGAKRRILEVRILPDGANSSEEISPVSDSTSREELIQTMLDYGLWAFVIERPFSVIANPEAAPKAIFVSGFDSSPLAPDADYVMEGLENDFTAGMKALVKLADGKPVHLNAQEGSKFFKAQDGVTLNTFKGPHPAGNVGVQIHKIDPINKGEIVWHVNPQDVANIGRCLSTGKVDLRRTFAVTGANAADAKYYTATIGTTVKSATNATDENSRIISGNVLTGEKIAADGFLGYYDSQVTIIPEGNEHQFVATTGWMGPGLDKFSLSRTFPTWLLPKSKNWNLNTNTNGEERAYVMSGQYEKVFPFDILPVHLVKSIIVNDIDAMEKLGIYEVAPEDFALCEYGCTSKINVQALVRDGLDLIKRECA
jgi:Na+-transporting NADH:ubiquinone oxidoreductase subunit A